MKELRLLIDDEYFDELDKLKEGMQAPSKASIIMDALMVFGWAFGEWCEGAEIMARKPDGEYVKPVFTFFHKV
jgi:hypothetical protein